MASTNKTTNYELSQYVANDKPTYLVDYNSDMNKIDTRMKANSDLAGLAKSEADELSSRVDGQDVIIGTLNTTVGQHTTDISSLNTDVSAVNTKVGDLTNLNTTDKTDVVSAVNEVNTKVGDLTNLETSNKSSIVNAINEIANKNIIFATTVSSSMVGDGTEHLIPMSTENYIGNDIAINSNGEVTFGFTGKVKCMMTLQHLGTSGGYIIGSIYRKRAGIDTRLTITVGTENVENTNTTCMILTDVQPGDLLYCTYRTASANASYSSDGTHLFVERVI